ncbi:MAG: hypothetical protein M3139_05685 [Bacteroidota bacterium]|nr:hypothetical protein [Bacteroidota bacterium]
MTISAFTESLSKEELPQTGSVYLDSLWYAGKGNWDKAHTLIQDVDDRNAAWIHAYLHRQEGDISNADYWYRRAGKKSPDVSIEKEWKEIVAALI